MEQAADGLAADGHPVPLAEEEDRPPHAHRLRGCRSPRASGWLPRRRGPRPTRAPAERGEWLSLLAGQPGDPLGPEPLQPAVDGPRATEEHGLDGVPCVPSGQQENDVGPEPQLGIGVLAVDGQQLVPLPQSFGVSMTVARTSVVVNPGRSSPGSSWIELLPFGARGVRARARDRRRGARQRVDARHRARRPGERRRRLSTPRSPCSAPRSSAG